MTFAAGSNSYKQLGEPDFLGSESLELIRVGDYLGLMNIEAVSAGDGFSLVLNDKGEVCAWGYNYYRNLGLGDTTANKDTPTILQGDLSGKRVVSIAACKYHGLAADDSGSVYAWGTNKVQDDAGESTGGWLGYHQDQNRYTPSKVSLKEKVVKVACGRFHSIVLTNKNQLYSWGGSLDGQLGRTWGASDSGQVGIVNEGGTLPTVTIPRLVFPSSTKFVISIAASQSSTFIALNDGRAYSWGSNAYGELGTSGSSVIIPTQIAMIGSLGIKELKSSAFSRNIGGHGLFVFWTSSTCPFREKKLFRRQKNDREIKIKESSIY